MRNDTALTLALLSSLCLMPLQAMPQIYKWVDEQGRTTYSSTPPSAGAKNAVVVPIAPTPEPAPAVSTKPDAGKPATKPSGPKLSPEAGYTSVQLTSPEHEETIWSNSGEVPFSIALQPALKEGHRIRVLVNGGAYGELLDASQGMLSNLERGSYTLQAEVVDRSGREVAATNSVTFYLQQASKKSPTRKGKK